MQARVLSRKLHSIVPHIDIPCIDLEKYIWKKLYKWHNKTAVVCAATKRQYTYLELYNKTNSMANFLFKLTEGKRNDTVAIILPNLPEFPIAVLGAIQAGLKITTINPNYTPDEMGKQLLLTESKVIFTTNENHKIVEQTLQLFKLKIPTVIIRTRADEQLPNDTINFADVTQEIHQTQLDVTRNHDDTAFLLFSGGTTGHPKPIELTHRSIVSNIHQTSIPDFDIFEETNGSEQDIIPVMIPMYHGFGLTYVLLHGLSKGCKMVSVPKFTTGVLVNVLQDYTSSKLAVVPTIYHALLRSEYITPVHLMNVKTVVCSGAPLSANDVMLLNAKANGKVNVMQLLGSAESLLTFTQSMYIKNGTKPGGIGFLLPSTEAKVVSVYGEKTLGVNEQGEILIRGPQVMKGYHKNEKATQEAFTEDKWLKTGDVGYYDEDDHFFITDRIKDMIKVKGYQVYSSELEEIIKQEPNVADVAVIGVPHNVFGEVPKAFVVPKRGSLISPNTIQEYVKSRVVNYKQLRGGVFFIDSIPRSPIGKILKKELKNL
ncbi:hypothetical protein RI129_005470 [Pyrocoelia pectoralis]|uniref:Uncharacterized protein n=1 Tax=Pyrocoelia pectoralis TaxID=417401 RepID=A0AAN7VK65_9COLE